MTDQQSSIIQLKMYLTMIKLSSYTIDDIKKIKPFYERCQRNWNYFKINRLGNL